MCVCVCCIFQVYMEKNVDSTEPFPNACVLCMGYDSYAAENTKSSDNWINLCS